MAPMQRGICHLIWVVVCILLRNRRNAAEAACLSTLNELSQLEDAVLDWAATQRKYTLCANTQFVVGRFDYSYNLIDGQDPLIVRPNIHVRCGDDGRRANNCILMTGDILLKDDASATPGLTTSNASDHPIVLQGLTFADPGRHFVKLTQPYEVFFVDCEFRSATRAVVPLLLDFYRPMASAETRLKVHWSYCDFDNNVFGSTANAEPGMIVATNHQVALSLRNCHFSNNDYITDNKIVSLPDLSVRLRKILTVCLFLFSRWIVTVF